MLPGPIFRVELVAAARQRRYFLLRLVYGGIILFTLWASYTGVANQMAAADRNVSISQMAEMAKTFFTAFSWVQLLGILAIGPAMAVGTIATERERRTIEYLFATDLSNLEIVLGKTFARLLVVFKFVLVSLPILMLFRMLGGIPADMLAASFIVSASTGLFLTAMSVCVSVWSTRSRDAAMRVYRILFALLILPLVMSWIMMVTGVRSGFLQDLLAPILQFLESINPLWVFGAAMSGVYGGGQVDFDRINTMAAYHAGLSAALVALSTAAVRRVHLRESSASSKPKEKRRLARGWLPRWRPAIGENAMVWKEAFAPTSKTKLGLVAGAANILIVVAVMGVILYMFAQVLFRPDPYREMYFAFNATITGVVGSAMLILLASRASGLVTIEKERDCWVSLLATPLSGGEIMRGKMWGNLYAGRWGFFLLAFSWGLSVLLDPRYLLAFAAQSVAFVVLAWFVTNLGLYFSLTSKSSLRAMGFTLGVGSFIGGLYLACCCPIMAIAGPGGPDETAMLGLAPCMPFLLVAPTALFSEGFASREAGTAFAAFLLGVGGYACAAALLMNYFAQQADELAGRTKEAPDLRRPVVRPATA